MRAILNERFPIWSWEIIKEEFIGTHYVKVHGRLSIVDNGIPRHYDGLAAHRITIAKGKTGADPRDFKNISGDLKSANTDCFKVAVNRLCNVADDVYKKIVEDYELTENQRIEIRDLHIQLPRSESDKIRNLIANGDITSVNYDASIKKIKSMLDDASS
jgi:hypothetical protein